MLWCSDIKWGGLLLPLLTSGLLRHEVLPCATAVLSRFLGSNGHVSNALSADASLLIACVLVECRGNGLVTSGGGTCLRACSPEWGSFLTSTSSVGLSKCAVCRPGILKFLAAQPPRWPPARSTCNCPNSSSASSQKLTCSNSMSTQTHHQIQTYADEYIHLFGWCPRSRPQAISLLNS